MLIPPAGFIRGENEAIDPSIRALHHAHLRSPHLLPATTADVSQGSKGQCFQYVKAFAVKPTFILPDAYNLKVSFDIEPSQMSLVLQDATFMHTDRILIRPFTPKQIWLRLKCVAVKAGEMELQESDFVVSETFWPPAVFLEVNSKMLELRRKGLHHKDLPVDITAYLREGKNTLLFSRPRISSLEEGRKLFIAVEVVEILTRAQILQSCTTDQMVPKSETMAKIARALAPLQSQDDDDLSMSVNELCINLADPFTSRIFKLPVRGKHCEHRECFDLETFLQTRKLKGKGQPSAVDVWKCPICDGDARPSELGMDEFLYQIRNQLVEQEEHRAQSDEEVKGIWVDREGRWRPKIEVARQGKHARAPVKRDGSSSDSNAHADDDDAHVKDPAPHKKRRLSSPVLIELD